ncbi:polysaccharide deacetylase family protein [Streptomyces sp. NPDC048266]|uniref:polysaccharide deacetylase family protein n=1 Tax=Streptomyces sp. NPDC048266 TaxID=3155787 RepID=UPI0033E89841
MKPTDRRGALRAGTAAALAGALATACGTAPRPAAPAARRPAPAPHAAPAPLRLPGQPAEIAHGPRDRPRVALTFHGAGDPALARTLLTQAEKAGARVTVLAVGSWLDAHPDMARRILDGGHDLGNHTQHHTDVTALTEAGAHAEIEACATRLRRLTGSIGTWFRPSRTRHATPAVLRAAHRAGYPHVLSYDVDSLDFSTPDAAAVVRNVTGTARAGSVVSLHFGYPVTAVALPLLLADLDRRGLRAVTTTELLTR